MNVHYFQPVKTLTKTNSFYVLNQRTFWCTEMISVEEQQSAMPTSLLNSKLDAGE